jgi:NADH-quinone oxidoreductase subunit E
VCTGTACHVRGAKKLLDKLERELRIRPGETTEDGRFSVESVRCVGCCGLAPVIVVDENFHGKLAQKDIEKILEKYE